MDIYRTVIELGPEECRVAVCRLSESMTAGTLSCTAVGKQSVQVEQVVYIRQSCVAVSSAIGSSGYLAYFFVPYTIV